jgi:hypothetical protein
MIMRKILLLMAGLCLLTGCGSQTGEPHLDAALLNEITSQLKANHQSPEDYVLSKFDSHDVVFLGERHRLLHDVALVRDLIPRLYRKDIYILGIEFARFVDQEDIDHLITADTYDEALARRIQFNQWPFWGYQDYIDIYKTAWEHNRTLPDGARPFRVLGLNAISDFSHIWTEEDKNAPDVWKKAWPQGSGDRFMADVILNEIVAKGEKALIYAGAFHAFTRYHQPFYNSALDSVTSRTSTRMGNLVYGSIGSRCFNINLHSPWPKAREFGKAVLAADGYIDAMMERLTPEECRAGFDVTGTTFEKLPGTTSYWSHGYPDFKLGDFCDGYIIQMPLQDYRGVSVAEGFINESNRLAAISQSLNPKAKDSTRTTQSMMKSLRRDTEIQRIFKINVQGYE